MKVKISAVIITFNEEKNIGRCLTSLNGVVDEIIVVDSFSTDKTKEICLGGNATFIEHKFEGHIEQKNWAYTQASNDFVLSLDADEALTEELKKNILSVKNNWISDGYEFNRLNNYCGKWIRHCGWYPDVKLRLWDRRKGSWKGINPHDEFLIEEGEISFLKGDLLHYSFHTVDQHKKQIEYFSDLAAKALFDKGKNASVVTPLIKAVAKFVKSYFLKLGFLDGYYGLLISWLSAGAKFKKYAKLRGLNK